MFEVSPTISNEEYHNRIAAMTRVKRKVTFRFAYVPAFMMCLVLGVIVFGNVFNDNSTHSNAELQVGRYMHESGKPGKFIEIFDDGTLQIFGFDYYEWLKNQPIEISAQAQYHELFARAIDTRGQYSLHNYGQVCYDVNISGSGVTIVIHIVDKNTFSFKDGEYTFSG